MDLLDFESEALYFDEPMPEKIKYLLNQAADSYAQHGAEPFLLEANRLAPDSLSVLVGLYRYYFYQHDHAHALVVAHQVMRVVAPRISFPMHWRDVDEYALGRGVMTSISLVRFYLLSLKAAGYINLRLARFDEGKDMLSKVVSLDESDRLGARSLLDYLDSRQAEIIPFARPNQLSELQP
ncbi:MAG: hypothetical protein HKM02_11775 [Pseudomonadales bacterium]|nr:hypothetical protein [Pseudomonadales bacterium]